jgi:hypothetical protein
MVVVGREWRRDDALVGEHARDLEQTVTPIRWVFGHELDELCLPYILEPRATTTEQEVQRRQETSTIERLF